MTTGRFVRQDGRLIIAQDGSKGGAGDSAIQPNMRPTWDQTVTSPESGYADASDSLANHKDLYIEFYYIPTGASVKFKSFLTAFTDNFVSSWNDVDVYGRMDPITTFQGTRRTINFSFDVISHSEAEANNNFANSQFLLSFLYPVYDEIAGGATSISTAPLIKIKFANLIHDSSHGHSYEAPWSAEDAGLVGKLRGLTYEPDIDQGFFDRGVGRLVPKLNRFNCEFDVLHSHPLGWNKVGERRQAGFPYTGGNFGPSNIHLQEQAESVSRALDNLPSHLTDTEGWSADDTVGRQGNPDLTLSSNNPLLDPRAVVEGAIAEDRVLVHASGGPLPDLGGGQVVDPFPDPTIISQGSPSTGHQIFPVSDPIETSRYNQVFDPNATSFMPGG